MKYCHVNENGKMHLAAEKEGKLYDLFPLTLEEVFIYELGGMGYEFDNIVTA